MQADRITAGRLEDLRGRILVCMSPARFEHTLRVERMVTEIGRAYIPNDVETLRTAALLHDITKEYSSEKQLKICRDFGIILRDDERGAPGVLHAITAAAIIPTDYPGFASHNIISAVRWHTTGRAGMSLHEKILFLADYIEEGREYPLCTQARELYRSADPSDMSVNERERHLDGVLLLSLRGKLDILLEHNWLINTDTKSAYTSLSGGE